MKDPISTKLIPLSHWAKIEIIERRHLLKQNLRVLVKVLKASFITSPSQVGNHREVAI